MKNHPELADSSNFQHNFLIELPSVYKEISGIVLIPSLTLGKKSKKFLRQSGFRLNNGPLLADFCFPEIISTDANKKKFILISPFIGYSGICYILELIMSCNDSLDVCFFGTACSIISNENVTTQFTEPELFSIETDIGEISEIGKIENSKSECSDHLLSIINPVSETTSKIRHLSSNHGVSLIDMECSYIYKVTKKYNSKFYPLMIISDYWDLVKNRHYLGTRADKLDGTLQGLERLKQLLLHHT
ncbi:MAG TPA: hypothetical protein PKA63_05035 [Oligoflexia bacterium]|nr:hypothetical protein [Oligoflexia bacterium]HMP48014.1 hypothetical protein [Oligoflexia bacterium]